jgi:LruC domain-containing protein
MISRVAGIPGHLAHPTRNRLRSTQDGDCFGDYDFNDMVVDYRFTQYANAENKVAKMDCELVLKAVGASFQNGFGFALDLDPSKINKTEGQEIFGNTTVLQSNGTESGQSKAVIIASDNLHQSFGTFGLINTIKDGKAMTPDTVKVSLTMTAPVASSELGYAPFNPFAIINQQRGMEVHLPGYPPTELADRAVFGTANDNTDLTKESYYRSKEGLPWAMNLPVSFAYPLEGQSVTDAYIHFNQWAKSYGFSYMDWYINKEGYRDNTKIYP